MARTKKNLTLEEKHAKITSEIEEMEASIKELKKTKKELEEQIKMSRLVELDEIISASGKSLDEIKELITSKE
jgi:F0F1-type ATP synthase membrane subunit b/b'